MTWLTWVPNPVHEDAVGALTRVGEVALGYGPSPTVYADVAEHVQGVVLRSSPFRSEEILAAPNLRIIARHGVGHDSVDLAAATARGVPVTVTPGANANAVAEHTIGLMLTVARGVPLADRGVRTSRWSQARVRAVGIELSGATLGLYGLGQIGKRVAEIAHGFGMTVIASDPNVTTADAGAARVRLVDPEELLASSTVLSLHLPLTESTRGLIGAAALAELPRGAIVINTSRGGLIDEAALAEAVESGHLSGAGLDVVEDEPLADDSPLLRAPEIVLTPHIGGQTAAAMRRAGLMAAESIRRAAAGETLEYVVNGIS